MSNRRGSTGSAEPGLDLEFRLSNGESRYRTCLDAFPARRARDSPFDIRHTTFDIRHTTYDIRHSRFGTSGLQRLLRIAKRLQQSAIAHDRDQFVAVLRIRRVDTGQRLGEGDRVARVAECGRVDLFAVAGAVADEPS